MKFTTFFAILATVDMNLAKTSPTVIDYAKLPSCALNCRILEVAEASCIPPDASLASREKNVNCVCQSEHLKSLHSSGEICYFECGKGDDDVIHNYYNELCSTTYTDTTSTPRVASAPTTATASPPTITIALTSLPAATETNSTSSSSSQMPKQERKGAMGRNNPWRYILLIVALTCFCTIFGICAFLWFRRRTYDKVDVEKPRPRSRSIPLQVLVPSVRSHPNLHDPEPRTALMKNFSAEECCPPEFPPRCLSPSPSRSFANSLRFYAENLRDEEEKRRRRGSLMSYLTAEWQSTASMESFRL